MRPSQAASRHASVALARNPMRKPFTWTLAALFGLFHLAVVMGPYIAAGGVGEAVGWRLLIFDYPITFLLQVTGVMAHLNDAVGDVIYGVFGTIMYALVGALLGYGIDRLRARRRQAAPAPPPGP
jgi:hypothetical protein